MPADSLEISADDGRLVRGALHALFDDFYTRYMDENKLSNVQHTLIDQTLHRMTYCVVRGERKGSADASLEKVIKDGRGREGLLIRRDLLLCRQSCVVYGVDSAFQSCSDSRPTEITNVLMLTPLLYVTSAGLQHNRTL